MNDARMASSLSDSRRVCSMSPARRAGVTASLVLATILPVAIEASARVEPGVGRRADRTRESSLVS